MWFIVGTVALMSIMAMLAAVYQRQRTRRLDRFVVRIDDPDRELVIKPIKRTFPRSPRE